jgi:hypothetical protein
MRSSIISDSQTFSEKTTSTTLTSSSISPTKCPWEVAMVMEATETEVATDADMNIMAVLVVIMEVITMIKTVMREREKNMWTMMTLQDINNKLIRRDP